MTAPVLLNPRDPNPVRKILPDRVDSPFVLVGDHAGSAIPQSLGDLGLSATDRARHIAVDLGSQAMGEVLAHRLGAPFLSQAYSRLVIDCNRAPGHAESIVEASDGTPVPGNIGLDEAQRTARVDEVLEPYQRAIAELLDARGQAILVSLHSFTPMMGGTPRPWEIGVLHDGHQDAFALRLLGALQARGDVVVGDNQPYRMDDTDYTVPRHAYPRGLSYAEIEVRQDLLANPDDVERMATILAGVLKEALNA